MTSDDKLDLGLVLLVKEMLASLELILAVIFYIEDLTYTSGHA